MSEQPGVQCPHCEFIAGSLTTLSVHHYWTHFTCPTCGRVCSHDDYTDVNGTLCRDCRAKAKDKDKERFTH